MIRFVGCRVSLSLLVGCVVLGTPSRSTLGVENLVAQADDIEGGALSTTARQALEQAGRELSRIASRVSPAVVHIESDRGRTEETGSGVIMRHQDGTVYVVTNRHVVTETPRASINVRLQDGQLVHPTAVLEDRYTDIAVLKVDVKNASTVEWGNSDELEIGHFVLAVGSPFGLSQSITLGIISAKSRRSLELGEEEILNQDFLQTDAAINPGNSGGPLIDLHGNIVGINTAIASQGGGNEGIGFSIPSKLVRFVVDELLAKGEVKRGYLGVRLDENFDDNAANRYHLDRLRGARVVEVYGNSPAEAAGVSVDDVILSFNGEDVEDENHLINRVSLTPVNSTVPMVVLRAGRNVTVQVTLKERPPRKQRSSLDPKWSPQILPAGLELAALTDDLAVQAGQHQQTRGLLVLRSPSAKGDGLKLYDVIVEAAREPVHTVAELELVIAERGAGKPVLLRVARLENGRSVDRLVLYKTRAKD
jgi:serine protease Do